MAAVGDRGNERTTPDPTTLGVLVTALTGMGTAIGVLWRQIQKHLATIEEKLKDCETDRVELWKQLAKQAGTDVKALKKQNGESE